VVIDFVEHHDAIGGESAVEEKNEEREAYNKSFHKNQITLMNRNIAFAPKILSFPPTAEGPESNSERASELLLMELVDI
jgi:hypothetical protein